ncbi:MAG: hypothetical protein NUV54_00185 [Candidatus Taylorbacteria bacterium]|nr:hypothetical protein [Candidatus Taylorbacteria bacterium]
MDTKFQTSFIPKKNLVVEKSHSRAENVSIFFIISVVLFIASLAAAGGVFAYKRILISSIDTKSVRLVEARNSFEPEFIDTANDLNKRIEAVKQLLSDHTVITPLFAFLEDSTLASIKFDEFSYDVRADGTSYVALSGQAKNYSAIALQSDIFGKEKFVKSPVFSGLNPDKNGNIVFKFDASLDPTFLSYKESLKAKN